MGAGRKVQEGGDPCTLQADSRCCMAEPKITLESYYLPIKKYIKNLFSMTGTSEYVKLTLHVLLR